MSQKLGFDGFLGRWIFALVLVGIAVMSAARMIADNPDLTSSGTFGVGLRTVKHELQESVVIEAERVQQAVARPVSLVAKLGGEALLLGPKSTDESFIFTGIAMVKSDQRKLTGEVIVFE